MIDYLEQLFSSEQWDREEEQGDSVPSLCLTEEQPQGMKMADVRAEQPQNMTAAAFPKQEQDADMVSYLPEKAADHSDRSRSEARAEEIYRVSPASEAPLFEAYKSPLPDRYRPEERDEPLEHRLRRNSRRYDSGFFLY